MRIALQSFGGPAGQIAVMQREVVDERRWVGQQRFLHALNFCMLLPGPEAQQLSIYLGWLLNGRLGGIIAGALFVLPGFVALLVLSALYVALGTVPAVAGVLLGLAAGVVAVVAQALVRVARRSLTDAPTVAVAVLAFAAVSLLATAFPLVVLGAGLVGRLLGPGRAPEASSGGPAALVDDAEVAIDSGRRPWLLLVVGVVLWLAPVAAVGLLLGGDSVLTQEALFFSGASLVTFGGAYAVLAFVANQAVHTFHWLQAGEMSRGLALAETTPGPLIMVVQFVAFLGAYRRPGVLDPWAAAVLASVLVTWVTFVPSFLFVLLGAPFMERLRANRALAGALRGVGAAVVGVLASLAVSFATQTLFARTASVVAGPVHVVLPVLQAPVWPALGIAAVAAVLLFRLRLSVLRVLGVCAVLGLVAGLLGFSG